ncbi:Uu.00g085340.m01.CDS01 [Anthostomella pinea]|uniref:Uu.00g085340.m01.CDS01 n=1 Tax=Anthostomella pinea TaxID=933095 RepID=A0AAI8VM02_9PEZI|nr:Uu.00g085340.m01.CDS01 [Anthostomella pinea]
MSSKGTVLITGLNGYVAGRTAENALKNGYRVRGTVRKLAAGTKVKEALCALGYAADDIEVVEVSMICKAGALDEAARGCSAILHLASPLREAHTLPAPEVVSLAFDSTSSILESALKAGPQLQSVVYMSSAAAVFDMPAARRTHTEKDWNTTAEEIVKEHGTETDGVTAYMASKTAAERLFWKFREDYKPAFGMTALQPSYIVGEPLVPWETKEQIPYSNANIWQLLSGGDLPGSTMVYDDTIDIRDVARMVVWAASNPERADGERFLCSSAVGGPQAIADVLNQQMPSLRTKRGTPGIGYESGYKVKDGITGFDSGKAVMATGQDWIPYETTIVDTANFMKRYLG